MNDVRRTTTRRIPIWVLLVVVVVGLVPTARAATISLDAESITAFAFGYNRLVLLPSHDSFTHSGAQTANYGTVDVLAVTDKSQTVVVSGAAITLRDAESWIRFDLSVVCQGVEVRTATLRLVGPAENDTDKITVRGVTESWDQGSIAHNSRPSTFKLLDDAYLPSLSADRKDLSDDPSRATYLAPVVSSDSTVLEIDVAPWITTGAGVLDTTTDVAQFGLQIRDAKNSSWYSSENDSAEGPSLSLVMGDCPT